MSNTMPMSASGLPLFGDADGNGVLTSDENAALHVTLDVVDAGQLHELGVVAGQTAADVALPRPLAE